MPWPSNDPPPDGLPPLARNVEAEIVRAFDRAEVGDFLPLRLLLADPEVPWADLAPHRADIARHEGDVQLTLKARDERIRRDYRAERMRGATEGEALQRVAAKWGMDWRSVRNIVKRSRNAK